MIKKDFAGLPLWQFKNLNRFTEIKHYVSGREGGVSEGEVGSLNLGLRAEANRENVLENRRRVAEAMGVAPIHLVFPSQTHSDHVKLVQAHTLPGELEDTDALICNTPGICISVMSADCVPILLYDPVTRAVAAVHAGWRGTVAKILEHTVRQMQSQFDTQPSDLIAGIGPSICPEVYEVGPEVITAVAEVFGTKENLVSRENGEGKGFLNLWEANRLQLLSLGVRPEAIEVAGICTFTHSDVFFSARKSGNKAGRFAAGILIRG
jgi:hypothetical protein